MVLFQALHLPSALCQVTLSIFLRQDEHDGNNQALCIESTLKTKYI